MSQISKLNPFWCERQKSLWQAAEMNWNHIVTPDRGDLIMCEVAEHKGVWEMSSTVINNHWSWLNFEAAIKIPYHVKDLLYSSKEPKVNGLLMRHDMGKA